MGSILEGAAALIMFGPLLMPVAGQSGIDPLHFGVVLVIAMGIGLFAPPLGLGPLWRLPDRRRAAGGSTVRPMLGYLGLAVPVPLGYCVRSRTDAVAAASARLSVSACRDDGFGIVAVAAA